MPPRKAVPAAKLPAGVKVPKITPPRTDGEHPAAKAERTSYPKATKRTGRKDGATAPKERLDGKPANAKLDREWLKAQIAAGMIEDIAEDELDVPFGAMKRWKGDPAEVGSLFVLPTNDRRCTGRSRIRDETGGPVLGPDDEPLMRPCAHWAIQGGRVCVKHGGGTEAVKNAARMRLIASSDALIGALIMIALDPNQDAKARVAAINSALDRAGIKGGLEINVEVPGWQNMLGDMFGKWGDDE